MGYRHDKGDLAALFDDAARRDTRRAARRVAEDAGAAMTRAARAHTPRDTGRTAEQWETLPVRKIVGGYESGTANPSYIARFLEDGVDAHDLKPRGERGSEALSTPEGPRAGARHPGTRGHHMTAKAAAEVEAELPAIAQPTLTRWAREIERRAQAKK